MMEQSNYEKMITGLRELKEEAALLLELFHEESSIELVNDWCMMWRFIEKIKFLQREILINWRVSILFFEIENPKDRFAIQKFGSECFNNLHNEMDRLVKMGRTIKMDDYRCIDWVKRFTNCLTEYKQKLGQ